MSEFKLFFACWSSVLFFPHDTVVEIETMFFIVNFFTWFWNFNLKLFLDFSIPLKGDYLISEFCLMCIVSFTLVTKTPVPYCNYHLCISLAESLSGEITAIIYIQSVCLHTSLLSLSHVLGMLNQEVSALLSSDLCFLAFHHLRNHSLDKALSEISLLCLMG